MSNILLAPGAVSVKFALDPVYNNLASLYMLGFTDSLAEVDEWIKRTATDLSAEQMQMHWLLFEILYSAFEPDEGRLCQSIAVQFSGIIENACLYRDLQTRIKQPASSLQSREGGSR